jgi:peptide/nickel transport system substrate-binding protein
MKKTFLLVMAFILSIFVSGGCTKVNTATTSGQQQLAKTDLILAIGSEPKNGFDPTTGWGRYGSPLFQSTLLKRDTDLSIINDLAIDYQVSEDGLVWTVTIRDDVKFSDGEKLTAADIEYTFATAAASGSVIDLNNLQAVEAVSDNTVKFILKNPQSTFVNLLISTGIVPKHAHGQNYAENPIGSGPFKFIQWDKGQQLIVEANPLYYGQKPYFQKITFLFLSEDAAFAAAKAGIVDMAYIPPAFSKQDVSGMRLASFESVDNRGIMFPFVPSGGKTEDGRAIGNDVTADAAIRKAINVAVNRKALVDGVLEGQGTPAYTVCDGLPWWNPDTVIKDGDLDSAKKILADGGWQDKGSGILEKGNLKAEFTLVYPASDQTRQSLAIAVADMIKPLGINIKVEGKSWDAIRNMMHSNAVLFGWGSHNPLEMYNLFYSETAGKGWYNTGFYSNPAVDAYMDKALAAGDDAEANSYWQKALWDGQTGLSAKGDAPWAWLVNLKHNYLIKKNLDIGSQKIQPHGHGWPITDNIAQWRWVD